VEKYDDYINSEVISYRKRIMDKSGVPKLIDMVMRVQLHFGLNLEIAVNIVKRNKFYGKGV
jgi:hypothetical protein